MRELVTRYLHHSLSRRGFVRGLTKAGLTATAAQSVGWEARISARIGWSAPLAASQAA